LYAAEAWSAAARRLAQQGRQRPAARAAHEAHACRERCEEARTPLLATADPQRQILTAREREIAALAAAGMSSRDISERMVMSVRTVDNHLQRAYRKLGITGRDQLAGLL
jgi:DNA-binding CsgD family transcriptional regulator